MQHSDQFISSAPWKTTLFLLQMGADANELFILTEGSVEIEAEFVELPASQEALDLPAHVKAALPSL